MSTIRLGTYGPDWNFGVLVDHVPADAIIVFVKGEPHVKEGFNRHPILCGDFVEVPTEDGPITGNCGLPVTKDGRDYGFACEGHTEDRNHWLSLSEIDKAAWEYAQERN